MGGLGNSYGTVIFFFGTGLPFFFNFLIKSKCFKNDYRSSIINYYRESKVLNKANMT